MFERLGGERAREVAERYFRDPTQERLDEFMNEDLRCRGPCGDADDLCAAHIVDIEFAFIGDQIARDPCFGADFAETI